MTIESTKTTEGLRRMVDLLGVYSYPSALSIPLRGLNMRLVNTFEFYKLGALIGRLRLVSVMESDLAIQALSDANSHLFWLSLEELRGMEILSGPIKAVHQAVERARGVMKETANLPSKEEADIIDTIRDFERIFELQAPKEYTYAVDQLRGYLMSALVVDADQNFAPAVRKVLKDEVKEDIRQAGRCLAFELPTAAGIHMMRAFEKVLREYYELLARKDAGHTDIYKLIEELRKLPNADAKTLGVLDQIRDLHRNPLAHEVFLTMDEAVDVFDIAKSAITAMIRQTVRLRLTNGEKIV